MNDITLPRAVVKQALEALKDDQYRLVEVSPNQYEYKTGLLVEVGPNQYEYKTDLAIAALERALAQQAEAWVCPESPEHRYTKPGHCEDCGKTLVLAQQAEPVEPVLQGPVAWRYWKQKWNCWEYSDTKLEFPAVPAGTKMEPLYLVSPEVKPERPPVGTVHKSVKGGVVWNRWPDEMEDGTHLYVNPPPCQTCEALARTVMMDQVGKA